MDSFLFYDRCIAVSAVHVLRLFLDASSKVSRVGLWRNKGVGVVVSVFWRSSSCIDGNVKEYV